MILLLLLLLFSTPAFAATNGKVEVRVSADTDSETVMIDTGLITKYFTNDVIQTQNVTATAGAFTNFSKPTNAKALMIDVGTSRSLALKGVTGDVGISLDSTTPILIPLSRDSAVTVGVLSRSESDQTIRLYWL